MPKFIDKSFIDKSFIDKSFIDKFVNITNKNLCPTQLTVKPCDHKNIYGKPKCFMPPGFAALCFSLIVLVFAGCFNKNSTKNTPPYNNNKTPLHKTLADADNVLKIGIILPFNGIRPLVKKATEYRNSIELALRDLNAIQLIKLGKIQILYANSQGNPDLAVKAYNNLINKNVDAIIGPVTTREIKAISQQAKKIVPTFYFSDEQKINIPMFYQMSMLMTNQINEILQYAKKQNRKNIVAIIPNNSIGFQAEKALGLAQEKNIANIVNIIKYDRLSHNSNQIIPQIKKQAWQNIDAIFIADSPRNMAEIIKNITKYNPKLARKTWLSTSLAEHKALQQLNQNNKLWFSNVAKNSINYFYQKYQKYFNQKPKQTASLAYDAVAVILSAYEMHQSGKINETTITSPNGFFGVNGLFRFNKKGTVERKLSIYQYQNKKLKVIKSAPIKF